MSDKELQETYERAERNYEMLKDKVHDQYFEIEKYQKEISAYKQAYESMNESNQRLKTYIEIYKTDLDKLQSKIDKALEYIQENYSNEDGEIWHKDIEKILNILKGE